MKKIGAGRFWTVLAALAALLLCCMPGCKSKDGGDSEMGPVPRPPAFEIQEITGVLDTDFNENGHVESGVNDGCDIHNARYDNYAEDVTVDAKNGIVAVGWRALRQSGEDCSGDAKNGIVASGWRALRQSDENSTEEMVLWFYNEDGSPKNINENGNRIILGMRGTYGSQSPYYEITDARGASVIIDDKGRIVIAGTVYMKYSFLTHHQGERTVVTVDRVAGAIWRYTADGMPDDSFDEDGWLIYHPPDTPTSNTVFSDLISHDGDILAVGSIIHRNPANMNCEKVTGKELLQCDYDGLTSLPMAAVWRYGESGELVSLLNAGKFLIPDVTADDDGLPSCGEQPCQLKKEYGEAQAVTVDPEGRILATGYLRTLAPFASDADIAAIIAKVPIVSGLYEKSTLESALYARDLALWRFEDGELDSGFGADGVGWMKHKHSFHVSEPFFSSCIPTEKIRKMEDLGLNLTVSEEGSLLVAGHLMTFQHRSCGNIPRALTPTRVGSIIKYDSSGYLDRDFGNNGHIFYSAGDHSSQFSSVVLDYKGRILAVGSVDSDDSDVKPLAIRYDANDGQKDASFDDNVFIMNTGYARNVVLDKRGKAVIVGHFTDIYTRKDRMIIWRVK